MNKYRLFEEIGRGNYSTIHRAVRQADGRVVAVKKCLFPYSQLREKMNCQVAVLRKMQDHPCVVKLVEAIITEKDQCYMVFEHLPVSLIESYKLSKSEYSGTLPEQLIRSYLFQVALALDGLHRQQIMHRDIKPENIMVDGPTAKLIDFGLAKKNDFGANTEYVSTRWYRAPEILLGEPYSFSADVFSLGCVMLELYHSQEIFKGSSAVDQLYKLGEFLNDLDSWQAGYQKMLKLGIQLNRPGSKRAAILSKLPDDAKELALSMLLFNPMQRIRAQDLLRHRYFKNVQLPKVVLDFLRQRRTSKISVREPQNNAVTMTMKDVTSFKRLSTESKPLRQSPRPLGVTKRTISVANLMIPLQTIRVNAPAQQNTPRRNSDAPKLLQTFASSQTVYGLEMPPPAF